MFILFSIKLVYSLFTIDLEPNNDRPCDLDRSNSQPGMFGGFVPKCQSDGSYEQKQCQGPTGHCWCVNTQTGQELQGTRKGMGQGDVNCGKFIFCRLIVGQSNFIDVYD